MFAHSGFLRPEIDLLQGRTARKLMSDAFVNLDKHRLGGLQDAVYGIVLTLLVLELKLPDLGEHVGSVAIWNALVDLLPRILTWLLSFWVLALFWLGDAMLLKAVTSVDRAVARLSLSQLALASLLPFSTALIGEHGDLAVASVLYAFHVLALALLSLIRVSHVSRCAGTMDSELAAFLGGSRLRAKVTVACAALASGLGFVVPGYNMLALLPVAALPWLRKHGKL